MAVKRYIGNVQTAAMTFSVLSVSSMVNLPMSLTELSGQNAIFSFFYSTLYSLAIVFLLFKLAERVPGKNIFEIAKILCGKRLGGTLNILMVGYLFLELTNLLRLLGDYFNSSILLRTPLEIIILVVVAMMMYFGSGSIEDLIRTNDLFIPIFTLYFLFDPFLFLNEIDVNHLLPSFAGNWMQQSKSGILGMGALGDVIVVGAFMNNVRSPRAFYLSVKSGIFLSVLLLTIWIFLIITVISPTTASRSIYIGWTLVQQIHITDFLDRVDLIIIASWLPVFLIKLTVLYISVLTGLAALTKDNSYKRLNVMTGLLLVIASMLLFNNVIDTIKFYNYGMLPVEFGTLALFFASCFAALWIRRRKFPPVNEQQGDKHKFGRGVWLMLGGCLIAIVAGNLYGNMRGIYGTISMSAYLLFFIMSVVLALNDFRKQPDMLPMK